MYKAGPGISVDVINAITPIYADLTQGDILQKYLYGLTENPDESFNFTIWEHDSKRIYRGFDTQELGVYDNYNNGRKTTLKILHPHL